MNWRIFKFLKLHNWILQNTTLINGFIKNLFYIILFSRSLKNQEASNNVLHCYQLH